MTLSPLLSPIYVFIILCQNRILVHGRLKDAGKHHDSPEADAELTEFGEKLSQSIMAKHHIGPGKWRWHAQVHTSDDRLGWHCSGSLLTPQWVITSAHCARVLLEDTEIILGRHNRYAHSDREQKFQVSKIIEHPRYNSKTLDFDFALLKLKHLANIDSHVGTIRLPESTARLPVDTICWKTGWRETSHDGQLSSELKELDAVITRRDKEWPYQTPSSAFLTTVKTPDDETCSGDSGGPVVRKQDGKWYLEGVQSFGRLHGCGKAGQSNGQANVRVATRWIKDTIKNN